MDPAPALFGVGIAPGEAMGAALARIGAGQFDRVAIAVADGPDRDLAVHEARKALKRLRALLRLAADHLDGAGARDRDRHLRDLGRRLAPLRDAAAAIETLDAAAPGGCPLFRSDLEAAHDEVMRAAEPGAPLPAAIAAASGEAAGWWAGHLPGVPDGFDAVAGGLGRTYRRGRKAMRRALERRGDADFHEWRKEVKALRYQVEALLPGGGGPVPGAALYELGEALGAEHDLTVLLGLAAAGSRAECAALVPVLEARRERLRSEAAGLGAAVFASGGERFVAAAGQAWSSARHASPGLGGLRR